MSRRKNYYKYAVGDTVYTERREQVDIHRRFTSHGMRFYECSPIGEPSLTLILSEKNLTSRFREFDEYFVKSVLKQAIESNLSFIRVSGDGGVRDGVIDYSARCYECIWLLFKLKLIDRNELEQLYMEVDFQCDEAFQRLDW